MNTRIMQIALKIALIREEFKEAEILQAVQFLEEKGTTSALLDHLAGRDVKPTIQKPARRKTKPIDEQRSQAVIALEQKDPEKYQVLSEFDSMLRKSEVLPQLSDIRRLGEQLSKDFPVVKSRKEAISKLMTTLADHPIEGIREILQSALSSSNLDKSEYQQLAGFIITGETTKPTAK